MLMGQYERLQSTPLQQDVPTPVMPLARDHVIDALRACRELEIYVEGNYNSRLTPGFYDLGYIQQVEIDGDDVHITMIMPYDGRHTWFDWFADVAETEIRRRMPSVGGVRIEQVFEPEWTVDRMTVGARRLMGLPVSEISRGQKRQKVE